jgi:hypothetical protein
LIRGIELYGPWGEAGLLDLELIFTSISSEWLTKLRVARELTPEIELFEVEPLYPLLVLDIKQLVMLLYYILIVERSNDMLLNILYCHYSKKLNAQVWTLDMCLVYNWVDVALFLYRVSIIV